MRKTPLILVFFSILISNTALAQEKKASVFFDLNDCNPKSDMSALKEIFNCKGTLEVRLIGSTDAIGETAYNQQLSECRVEATAMLLKKKLGERLTITETKGIGETKSNQELEIDPKSRKVDIIWVSTEPKPKKKKTEPVTPKPEVKVPVEKPAALEVIEIDSSNKENIVLEGLSFIPGRHYTLPESGPILEKLLNTMKTNQTLEIEIQGFICCDYTVEDGYDNDTGEPRLSLNRAKFVYKYLMDGGIAPSRLSYKGYGSTRPKVFPERSPEDQQANRRVEIRVVKY